ncbi:hypothetical protein [Glutamicibacter ardleyensis]|uniref:hypothetical protein n=1 Tax=Glutamicibacter ardleyensis TaxID=225894 RepID=UPI003FD3FFF7
MIDKLQLSTTRNEDTPLNAAKELASIFRTWNKGPSDKNFYNVRGTDHNGLAAGTWRNTQIAADLTVELDFLLNTLQEHGIPRSSYDSLLVRIWRFIILPETAWSAGSNKVRIADDDIVHLETLGHLISARIPQAHEFDSNEREQLLGLLAEASTASDECTDLPKAIRTRLSDLLTQLSSLLDPDNDHNSRHVQRTLDRITALLLQAVWAEKKPDLKFRLLNIALRFAQTMSESASYDVIKAIAESPMKDMLGLPPGEEG